LKRGYVLKQDTYALYLASRDRRVPWAAKIALVVVAAYALSPIDLIPDFVPLFGYLDDMVLVPLGIALAIKLIPAEIWQECKAEARTRLDSSLPSSRAAAIVIVAIWFAAICVVAWVVWSLLKANSNVAPNHSLQTDGANSFFRFSVVSAKGHHSATPQPRR
jgi:uncharacterized membrane protein YkvA (DUF1232 family)